jgi:hypothetical protein
MDRSSAVSYTTVSTTLMKATETGTETETGTVVRQNSIALGQHTRQHSCVNNENNHCDWR